MQNPNMQWTRSHHNWVVTRTAGTVMVGEASTGREALEQFRSMRPDVTLMDTLALRRGIIQL